MQMLSFLLDMSTLSVRRDALLSSPVVNVVAALIHVLVMLMAKQGMGPFSASDSNSDIFDEAYY